eukprot:2408-Heterococcus_DN1.PRE.2
MDTVRAALLLRAKDIMMALQKSKQQRQLDAAAAATAANSAAAGADGTDSSTEATSAAAAAAAASNRLTTDQHRRLEIELLKLKILQLQHNCRQKQLLAHALVVNSTAQKGGSAKFALEVMKEVLLVYAAYGTTIGFTAVAATSWLLAFSNQRVISTSVLHTLIRTAVKLRFNLIRLCCACCCTCSYTLQLVLSALKGRPSRDTQAVNASQLLDRGDFTRYQAVKREVLARALLKYMRLSIPLRCAYPQLQLLEPADQRRRQVEIEDAKRKRYHQFLRAVSAHRDEFIKFHRYKLFHIVPAVVVVGVVVAPSLGSLPQLLNIYICIYSATARTAALRVHTISASYYAVWYCRYVYRARKVESLRVAKAVEKQVELRTQRAEREGDKAERKRLAALKANDMDAYSKLVEETKNERLKYLLSQTDRYIEEITVKINQQRDSLKPTSNSDAAADNASPRAHNGQQ